MTLIDIPEIKPVAELQVREPECYTLDNGISVYGYNGAANEIVKVNLIFEAGRWVEDIPLTAAATSTMMKSGTDQDTAFELEEAIDHLGSTIKASAGYNGVTLSLYCMTRHLEACLKIFSRILHRGIFPEHELELHKTNSLARLKVNLLKNDYVGDMLFKELLFGNDHPYGYQTTAENITALKRDMLMDYYRNHLTMSGCFIGISGKYAQKDIDLLNKYLGQAGDWEDKAKENEVKNHQPSPSGTKKVVKELKDSVQASIFIGMPSIHRMDPDFNALSLLNLIYGGYFGSRLMKNIREDKGLTYGIYSYIQQYRYGSAFIINTDTAVEYADQCLHEIYAEMERLRQQPIESKELGKATNYMMGRLLDQLDGPFKSAATFLGLKSHNIPLSYVKETERAIRALGPEELMDMARKYFKKEDMYEVVVK